LIRLFRRVIGLNKSDFHKRVGWLVGEFPLL
jgi:hypothetical protein